MKKADILKLLADEPLTKEELLRHFARERNAARRLKDALYRLRVEGKIHQLERGWALPCFGTCRMCTGRGWIAPERAMTVVVTPGVLIDRRAFAKICPRCEGQGWSRTSP